MSVTVPSWEPFRTLLGTLFNTLLRTLLRTLLGTLLLCWGLCWEPCWEPVGNPTGNPVKNPVGNPLGNPVGNPVGNRRESCGRVPRPAPKPLLWLKTPSFQLLGKNWKVPRFQGSPRLRVPCPRLQASTAPRLQDSKGFKGSGPSHQGSQGQIFREESWHEIIPGLQGPTCQYKFQVPGFAGGFQGSKRPRFKGSRAGSRLWFEIFQCWFEGSNVPIFQGFKNSASLEPSSAKTLDASSLETLELTWATWPSNSATLTVEPMVFQECFQRLQSPKDGLIVPRFVIQNKNATPKRYTPVEKTVALFMGSTGREFKASRLSGLRPRIPPPHRSSISVPRFQGCSAPWFQSYSSSPFQNSRVLVLPLLGSATGQHSSLRPRNWNPKNS